jgi:hypothetical protein
MPAGRAHPVFAGTALCEGSMPGAWRQPRDRESATLPGAAVTVCSSAPLSSRRGLVRQGRCRFVSARLICIVARTRTARGTGGGQRPAGTGGGSFSCHRTQNRRSGQSSDSACGSRPAILCRIFFPWQNQDRMNDPLQNVASRQHGNRTVRQDNPDAQAFQKSALSNDIVML